MRLNQSHFKFGRRWTSNTPSSNTILDKCQKVRARIQNLSDKVKGPLEKASQQNTVLPFVFLLGNHSSGKSSFINYVLQRKIQFTGVAPTDDSFTIIVPGPADVDRDGPALIGDPDMGFYGLKTFGPNLIHHTQLKIRSSTAAQDFMIVDTPGMIDSPTPRTSQGITAQSTQDRGYDFEQVCRWYAERADVILLFFDPDKPGTTGETLSILTNSLVGQDHKLHIILNKADQFRKIHDFARAYGSLCWNLSKVIQRKDLPRIYTMCLPSSYHAVAAGVGPGTDALEAGGRETLGQGIMDLEAAREDVVAEVFNAPKRRLDNEVNRLADSAAQLHMHCQIIADILSRYRRLKWTSYGSLTLGWLSSTSTSAGLFYLALPLDVVATTAALTTMGMSAATYFTNRRLKDKASDLASAEEYERTFKRLYARRIAERDEYTISLWTRVADILRHAITAQDIMEMKQLRKSEFTELEHVIEQEIPNLRRAVGPQYNKF